MKKWYRAGLLVLVLVMIGTLAVACGETETTTTTAPQTTTTAAQTTTSAAQTTTTAAQTTTSAAQTTTTAGESELGIFFEDQGNNVVKITDVPAPGMAFPVTTTGDMASTIEAFDADGKSLGTLQTDTGLLDYSAVADKVYKIVVTGPTGTTGEYIVPSAKK